jgi:hypothetical protein
LRTALPCVARVPKLGLLIWPLITHPAQIS